MQIIKKGIGKVEKDDLWNPFLQIFFLSCSFYLKLRKYWEIQTILKIQFLCPLIFHDNIQLNNWNHSFKWIRIIKIITNLYEALYKIFVFIAWKFNNISDNVIVKAILSYFRLIKKLIKYISLWKRVTYFII